MMERSRGAATAGLWSVLAALVLMRAALAFVPSMWGWGLNLLRFVAAVPGWALWLMGALALIPGVSRALVPAFTRAGEFLLRAPLAATLLVALGVAAVIWALPDRVMFTGDFINRNTTAAFGGNFGEAFPENLPLDNFLHASLPRALGRLLHVDAYMGLRMVGALEAGALFLLCASFVRIAAGSPMEAIAGITILFAGGYLTMFTGYAKSASELCLVTLLAGSAALRVARLEMGLPLAILAAAAGIAVHRGGVVLLPVVAALGAMAWRSELAGGAWRRPAFLAAGALLAGVLVSTGPRIVSIIAGYDLSHHFASPEIAARGGLLRAMFADLRGLDLMNATLVLSPLAAAIPILAALRGRSDRGREILALAGIALVHIVAALFTHPQQGLFRDWDVLTPAGVALSMLAAWLVMDRLRQAPAASWLGVAAALAALSMTGSWLLHEIDVGAGFRRARAFIAEPPRRTDRELGHVWLYIGDRTAQLQDWNASAEALAHAAEYQPSRKVFMHWGFSALQATDAGAARAAWRAMTLRLPEDPVGWRELALSDLDLGNHAEARVAAREFAWRKPADTLATSLLRRAYALTPSSSAPETSRTAYPAHWWTPVPKEGAPAWEILPQEAGPGEVILSKRHELGLLSNFAPTPFTYRARSYPSLEGFWQMMLYPEGPDDPRANYPGLEWKYTRDQVAQMTSFEAKRAGQLAEQNLHRMNIDWASFEGRRFAYRSPRPGEHYRLIVEATHAKVQQNPAVQNVLLATGDLVLKPDHHPEPNAPPEWRYFEILTQIRSELRSKP
jgi:predicted NAD-dependent protein-ADP-ribosyltransferase YbiA (DUF1768 family)